MRLDKDFELVDGETTDRETGTDARSVSAREREAGLLAKFFRALAEPTRLRLMEFLLGEEHSVSECVDHVGLSQGRVSVHLACLADCGYVEARRRGRHTYYRVADPRAAEIVGLARAFAADSLKAIDSCQRIDDGEEP